jgi:hypothetical protein
VQPLLVGCLVSVHNSLSASETGSECLLYDSALSIELCVLRTPLLPNAFDATLVLRLILAALFEDSLTDTNKRTAL